MLINLKKNEKVDVVVRPEDVRLVEESEGMVSGTLISKIFKGVHYEYIMMIGKNEVVIQDTRDFEINQKMGIIIEPDLIHIMHKDFTSNVYDGYITKNNTVVFAEGEFECDVTQLFPNSHLNEEGYLIDENGISHDLTDCDVKVEVGLSDIEIIDNEEDGVVSGEIISILYKGDHYQVIIRTKEEDDFVVDTEYTWNEFDRVSVKIPPEKIKLTLKHEVNNHEKD